MIYKRSIISFLIASRRRKRNIKFAKLVLAQTSLLLLQRWKNSIRLRTKLHSSCLLRSVTLSPWYKLYATGTDEELIGVISLNRFGFELLLSEFKKHYKIKSGPGKRGRPRRVRDFHCVLAIILHSFCSPAESKTWQEFFGVVPSTLSRLIIAGRKALEKSLDNLPEAAIRWPSLQEQITMALKVQRKESVIRGRWGFIDGKNYRVQDSGDAMKQNGMYNGWLHDVFVTGIACFTAEGLICYARLNYYGSWNDGEMSRRFCEKLRDPARNVPDHGVVSDTAFPVSNDMFGRILTPLKEGEIEDAPRELWGILTELSAACTSIRQGAEWGMGAVGKVYRILETKLPIDNLTRGRLLNILYRLYNFRVRSTGISQLKNYFDV